MVILYGVNVCGSASMMDYANSKRKLASVVPMVHMQKVFDIVENDSFIPSEIIIANKETSTVVKVRHNEKSPISLIIEPESRLLLSYANQALEFDINMVNPPAVLSEHICGQNIMIRDLLSVVGCDRLRVLPFDGCWNWNTSSPCKFCNLHPQGNHGVRPNLNSLPEHSDYSKWWEAHSKQYLSNLSNAFKRVLEVKDSALQPHCHLVIMAGGFPDLEYLWRILIQTVEALRTVSSFENLDSHLNAPPHFNINQLQCIKDMGIEKIQYNIEVYGKDTYEAVCPGKIPYETLMEKLIEAVEVFGKGNVRSNFVLGLQPLDTLEEGFHALAELGVVSDYSVFQPKRGTAFEQREGYSLYEIKKVTDLLIEVYKKHDFTPIYCSMSSRSSIINEVLYEYA